MYKVWPLPSIAVIVFSHESPWVAEKFATVIGMSNKDDAKIGGITPAVLSFNGKWELSPPNILLPTCLFGYWTISLLCALSIKTTKVSIITTKKIKPIIKAPDNAPCLPSWSVPKRAAGSSAIIPANISKDIPLPKPLDVICSPNHIKKIVPPTSVITAETLKNSPGSITTPVAPSSPTAIPQAWIVAKKTVPYLVYWLICLLPCSPPSFFK